MLTAFPLACPWLAIQAATSIGSVPSCPLAAWRTSGGASPTAQLSSDEANSERSLRSSPKDTAEIGQPLLQRQTRGMVPTDAGHVLASHTRRILRQMAAAEADLAEIAGLNRGSLTMGTFPTLGGRSSPW